jgi:GT2 family glycosyltransferase
MTMSLVLLTFNRWDRTSRLLDSLLAGGADLGDVELVWIENGSTDATRPAFAAWLDRHGGRFGRVVTRFNEANHGFVVGVNEGVCLASGQDVCLLNSDAVVGPGWYEGLRRALALPGVGAAGPVSDGMPWNQSLTHHGQGIRVVPVVYGFCLLAERRMFDRIGLLDERYGRGVIEVEDWCERASRAGFRFAVNTDVVVRHDEPHASYPPRVNRMLHIRNRRLFTDKWGVGPYFWGDRDTPRRRFARTVARVWPGEPLDGPALSDRLRTLGLDTELLVVSRHRDEDHLGWLPLGRRDPRVNVVCVRSDWAAGDLPALCQANARGATVEVTP